MYVKTKHPILGYIIIIHRCLSIDKFYHKKVLMLFLKIPLVPEIFIFYYHLFIALS